MRTCPNCKTEIEDKYSHCWNCGSKLIATQPVTKKTVPVAPQFASVDTHANLPNEQWVQQNQTRLRTCPNCNTEIEDKYSHCWNCGSKLTATQPMTKKPVSAVPRFTSVETEANLPNVKWFRLLPVRIVLGLVMLGILKILSSAFVGTYGLYIFIGAAVVAMLIILWRFFRRDPTEGVGIEL
jgi:hypothetical protein